MQIKQHRRRSYFHLKWQASKISRQVCIHWQQYLIYWKWCQHRPSKGMDVINRLWKYDIFDKIKWRFLLSCAFVCTTVWMHYMDTNKTHEEKAGWERHKNALYCFEQILEEMPPTKQQLTPPILSTIQIRWTKTCGRDTPVGEAKTNSWLTFFYKPLHMDLPVMIDQQGLNYISSVWTLDVDWRICQKQWMRERERWREKNQRN